MIQKASPKVERNTAPQVLLLDWIQSQAGEWAMGNFSEAHPSSWLRRLYSI